METNNQSLTVRQAYLCMFEFLRRHHQRGPTDDIAGLLGGLALLEDGGSADPAQMNDWMIAVKNVLKAESEGGYTCAVIRFSAQLSSRNNP